MSRHDWYAQDTKFLSNDTTRALVHRFGCAGPLVVIHLLGAAKVQDERGRVKMSYQSIKEHAALDRVLGSWWTAVAPKTVLKIVGQQGDKLARDIVAGLRELEFLKDFDEETILFEEGFTATITDWWDWQFPTRALTPAERQRAKRARDRGLNVDPERGDIFHPETGEIIGSILDPVTDGVTECVTELSRSA